MKQRKLLEYFGQFPFTVPYVVTGGVFGCGDVSAGALIFASMHYKAWKCTRNDIYVLLEQASLLEEDYESACKAYSLASFQSQEHAVASVWFESANRANSNMEGGYPIAAPLLFLAGCEQKKIDLGIHSLKIDRFIDVVEEDIIPLPKFFDTLFRECQNNETFVSL